MTVGIEQQDDTQPVSRVGLSCWPRLLSPMMLARYLCVGVQTIYNHRDEIPGLVPLGRSIRWDRLIVDEWITQGTPGWITP